jgi:fusion protein PurCD
LSAFVIKPDGLTGGKGVQVQGDHFQNFAESLPYMQELISKGESFVIEEKLIGQEFSLMSFCDGLHAKHMPAVQDHKRAYEDDKGPNTGGMGSYSCANHSLPFLKDEDIEEAKKINEQVLVALAGYKGILYGGFIATQNGVKLIEYNARFGDPEVMNYLSILKTDLSDISEAITKGELDKMNVEFENKATVCKYIVPEGYPKKPVKDEVIDISEIDQDKVDLYYASLDKTDNGLYIKGSRTLGIVAKADTLAEAEKIVQTEIEKVKGPVFFRKDIGTKELIEKRIKMMKELRHD